MFPSIKRCLVLLFVLASGPLLAQQFDIQNVYANNGKVYVDFTIREQYPNERYRIQLYSSHDNYTQPLQYVSGAIEAGELTSTTENLQLIWDAQKELKNFQGNVQLEIRGTVTYVPVHTDNQPIKAKHDKSTTISWDGGEPQNQIRIELIKSGQVIQSLGQVSNSGRYNWVVPDDVPKGAGYSIRLSNVDNPGESTETTAFKVGGKVGLAVKLLPVAALVVGGGIYAITSIDPSSDGNEQNENGLAKPANPDVITR